MTGKTVLASVVVVVTGALLGCLDAIAPGSPRPRGVSFSIAPVFDGYGARDGIPSDVDLIRIVLHHPPLPDTTLNFPIAPGQDSIRIEIPITLSGTVDTVGVTFQAIRTTDSTVLYSGSRDYPVSVGPPAPASPLVATYVGPGKNILSIAITPPSAAIRPGDSLAFGFLALDSSGATIIGMPVLFDSHNEAIATVSAAGEAHGVALGTTYVVVTSGARSSIKDSALVTVANLPPPAIGLSAAAAGFLDTAGTSDPAAQTINVTNAGGGTLSGLSLGAIVYGVGGSGWLTATLGASTAPTTLTLAVAKGSLAAGTYTATVPVQAAGASNTPQTVTVTFQIVAAPTIVLSSATVTFVDTLLTTDPASQTVSVTAAGGALSGLTLGTIGYGVGGTGWLTATLSGATAPATLTLSAAKGSLAAGTYTATVPVQAALAGNSPQNVSVTFVVVPAPTIGLAPSSITFRDTLLTSDPASQTVGVTAAGGALSGLALGTISYGVGGTGWLTASLSGSTTPATLTLSAAKGSLAAGSYTATVPVQSALAGNSPQNVSVTFQIAPLPLVTLVAAPGYRVMLPGDTVTLQASGKDGSGNPATPFGLSFTSRVPGVATVNSATGLVTAVGSGTAVIVAQAPTATGTTADSVEVVVPAAGSPVVAAIGDGRTFDVAKVGDTVRVRVLVDLRAVPGDALGSYNAELDWNPSALTYVSAGAVAGGFAAPTVNATNVSTGQLRFGAADAAGSVGAFALIEVRFLGAATAGTPLTLALTDLSTTAATNFTQLLPSAVIVSGSATIK